MTIRRLRAEDYEALIALWRRAGLSHRPHGRDSREALARQISRDGDILLVAEEGGTLIGSCLGSFDGRKGWLNRMAVGPDYRGRGVGKTLVAAVEAALRRRGAEVFAALVEAPNPASEALLQAAGYSALPGVRYFRKVDREGA